MSVIKIRTEKQYVKAMKNYTDKMWERIEKQVEEDAFLPGSEEDYK